MSQSWVLLSMGPSERHHGLAGEAVFPTASGSDATRAAKSPASRLSGSAKWALAVAAPGLSTGHHPTGAARTTERVSNRSRHRGVALRNAVLRYTLELAEHGMQRQGS